eukprot:TRINITY_DN1744_c0_g1_i3.p1 TRINITY_DN1744_c0_g1~~TRINITY_DN1744_c0_g1_i3.p1  ORF type:complete len:433 (+),score=84.78 TRINITY_DN1744_c0_g1_i3:217-1515(+)
MGQGSSSQKISVLEDLRKRGAAALKDLTPEQIENAKKERGPSGETLAHVAALWGDDSLDLLRQNIEEFDPNIADNEGKTPLWYAMKGGNEYNVSRLLSHGADFTTTRVPTQNREYKRELAPEIVEQPYEYTRLQIPLDEEGFAVSFSVDQLDEMKDFFERYGIVIVRNVITNEEADTTVNEAWEILQSQISSLDREKPSTWSDWATLSKVGILGNMPIMTPQALRNRQNVNIYNVFRALYGKDELTVSMDRIGMMRPTRNLKFSEDEPPKDMPKWKTISEWLHWDMDPFSGLTSVTFWKPNQYAENSGYKILKVQGILALVDCAENDGGFQAVPGFHRHLPGWAWANKDNILPSLKKYDTTFQVPSNDPIRNDIQRLPIRKGSILIWDSRICHGSYPNDSSNFRCVQYLKMGDAEDPAFAPFHVGGLLPENF